MSAPNVYPAPLGEIPQPFLQDNTQEESVSVIPWDQENARAGTTSDHIPVIRVRPNEIAHRAFMGHFLHSVEIAGMVKSIDRRGKSTVQAEYTVRDDRGHWQIVKRVREILPHVGVSVLPKTLIVESIHLRNLPTFVISSKNSNTMTEPNFQGHKQSYGLEGIVATIHVITHKKVVSLWTSSSNTKKLRQIVELSMDITTNRYWSSNRLHIRLLPQDFLRLGRTKVQRGDRRFRQDSARQRSNTVISIESYI
jgi:hypothetical protein